ncbi:hypothetical protein Tco_1171505, partial [Tanacetum coccineum]
PNRLASPRVNGYLVKASSNPFTFYDSPLPGVNTPWDVMRIVCNPELMDVAEVVQTLKTEDLSRKLEVNYVKFQFRGGLLGLKDLSRAETYIFEDYCSDNQYTVSIKEDTAIVDPIDLPNVNHDKLRVVIFPISLVGGARKWFDKIKESIDS